MYWKTVPHRPSSALFTALAYASAMLVMLACLGYYLGHQLIAALANWRFPCLPR